MGTHRGPGLFAAADVYYRGSGGARAAAVVAADAAFTHVLAEHTALTAELLPYQPGEFCLRELPPLRAVLHGIGGLGLLVVDGYADLDPDGRPGLGAHAHTGRPGPAMPVPCMPGFGHQARQIVPAPWGTGGAGLAGQGSGARRVAAPR